MGGSVACLACLSRILIERGSGSLLGAPLAYVQASIMAILRAMILSFSVLLFPIAVAVSASPHDHTAGIEHVGPAFDDAAFHAFRRPMLRCQR